MDLKPLTNDVIFELMFIALAMVLFSLLLNKLLGVRTSKMREIRDKAEIPCVNRRIGRWEKKGIYGRKFFPDR